MASPSLSLCASLAAHFRVSQNQETLFLSKPNSSILTPISRLHLHSSPSYNFSFCPIFSPRPTFHSLPKSSVSEAAVAEPEPEVSLAEPEPDGSEPQAADIVKASSSEQPPKREEIFAVVMVGSRQYIVFPGRFIYTQRLKGANVNDKVTLNKVLLVGTRTSTYIGKPVVTNAVVNAVVEEQGLDDKVIVFKYKKKKNYRRNIGHRQPNTRIRITSIAGYEDYPAVTLDSITDA